MHICSYESLREVIQIIRGQLGVKGGKRGWDDTLHHVAQAPHVLRWKIIILTELLHSKTLVSHRPWFVNMIYSRVVFHWEQVLITSSREQAHTYIWAEIRLPASVE